MQGLLPELPARLRLFDAFGATLDALASARPLLLVIEDLHWADSPAVRLLVHLAARRKYASLRMHRPIAHSLHPLLRPGALLIRNLAQRAPDLYAVSGLFSDLSDGAFDFRLAGHKLALGDAPVVVSRPVNYGDFDGGRIGR